MTNAYTPQPAPGGMDPAMITQILQYLMMQGGNGAGLLPQDISQLSLGFDPTGMQGLTLPQMPGTSRAVGSIEELGKQENALQDMADLAGLGDYGLAGMFGPGSFSADAFAPTTTSELIPQPETQRLEQWLQDPTSFEGWVATRVRQGKSPRAAIVEMRQAYETGTAEGASPAQQADAERIRLLLAPGRPLEDEFGNPIADAAPGPNWTQAFDDADKLVQPYLDEQRTLPPVGQVGDVHDAAGNLISAGGEIVQGDDGQLYRVTSEDSPLAQEYRDMGLPLPTDQYEPGDLLGADWQQADATFQDAAPGIQEQLDQMQADADRASARAVSLGEMPLQEFYDRGSVPQLGGGAAPAPLAGTGATTSPTNDANTLAQIAQSATIAPVRDTNTGNVIDANNPWPGLDPTMIAAEEAQRLRLEQERIAQEENPQQSEVWWQNALASVLGGGRPEGAPQASTPIAADGSTTSLDYTIDPVTGQPILTHGPSGTDAMWSLLHRQGADQPQPPTPGTATPDNALQSPAWQELLGQSEDARQRQIWEQASLPQSEQWGSGVFANQGHGPDASTQYLQDYNPPDPTLNSQGDPRQSPTEGGVNYLLKSLFGTGPWATPEHQQAVDQRQQGNTALGIGDYLSQYVLGGGTQPHIGAPPQPAYSPLPSTSPQMTSLMLQQIMGQQPTPRPSSPRTGAEPSETAGRYTSTRTGPEPSESVRRSSANTSGRTGPEPSEDATTKAVLRFMLGGGTDSNTLAQAGPNRTDRNRFTLGGGIDSNTLAQGGRRGGGNGKDRMMNPTTGFNRQGMSVLHARTDARNAGIARAQLQDRQTVAANRTYGRDYYRALGYTRAMRDLGITPYSSATANRTGGVNALLGRG